MGGLAGNIIGGRKATQQRRAAQDAGLRLASPMALALTDKRLLVLRVSPPIALGKGGDVKDLVSEAPLADVGAGLDGPDATAQRCLPAATAKTRELAGPAAAGCRCPSRGRRSTCTPRDPCGDAIARSPWPVRCPAHRSGAAMSLVARTSHILRRL